MSLKNVSTQALTAELAKRVCLSSVPLEVLRAEVRKRSEAGSRTESRYARKFARSGERGERRRALVDFFADQMKVHPDVLTSRDRCEPLASNRQVAMAAMREAGFGIEEVGHAFGDRHHATVLFAVRKVREKPELTQRKIDWLHLWSEAEKAQQPDS